MVLLSKEKAIKVAAVNNESEEKACMAWSYEAVPVVGNINGYWKVEAWDECGEYLGAL
jgi:hypothetical protein